MTRNLYLGASLDPITGVADAQELPVRVDEVWAAVVASDPPGRMAAVAREIAELQPDVVALQEAALWRVEGGRGYDFVELLLASLRERGSSYRVVAEAPTFGGALPAGAGGVVELQDRGALLAREGVEVCSASSGVFAAAAELEVAGLQLRVPRAFTTALLRVDGVAFRAIGTHLELGHLPALAAVQVAQARELAASIAAEPLPVVLAGDLNARPGTVAHAVLLAAGLADAWAEAAPGDEGFTCCQDRDLRNEESRLSERIDHVLQRGFRAVAATLTGDPRRGDRWPSDHAGVVVELDVPELDVPAT
jgi:endonuclease/exonuclease/phosphatase family metal-dependent hydrolase